MMMTDPIADMLTRVRNANLAVHDKVDIPTSKLKVEVAKILRAEGYIKNFKVLEAETQGILRIYLKYGPGNQRIISGLRRVSRPGLRVYATSRRLPRVMSGLGMAILSTSQGLMTERAARDRRMGGEVLCYVW
ncbi:MAG TPA: 30S ribosomal protein S8 [Candidatus Methylomirabilis sp.]|nr:30S ribosomal protein S8 [Candidatus Methylomirabilis sp.]